MRGGPATKRQSRGSAQQHGGQQGGADGIGGGSDRVLLLRADRVLLLLAEQQDETLGGRGWQRPDVRPDLGEERGESQRCVYTGVFGG